MNDEERQAMQDKWRQEERSKELELKNQRIRNNCGLMGEQFEHKFESFKLAGNVEDKNSQATALRASRSLCESFPDAERGIIFVGDPGVGKDYFLDCIANFLRGITKPPKLFKRYSSDLEKMFFDQWYGDQTRDENGDLREELYGKELPSDLEMFLRTRDLLLIGDLHKILGSKSQGVVSAITRVLKQASDTGKPKLCVSSMIPIRDGEADEQGNRLDYETLFGRGIASWLEGLMDVIVVTGPDRRIRTEAPKWAR